ncbi:MAG: hypothetical protein NTU53_00430, partial [Planctomycetota bacterium]|nr:hypothetical protein [Planctomycetota bacterium]
YDYAAYGEAVSFVRIDPDTQATTNITAAQAKTVQLFGGDGEYDPSSSFYYHDKRWRQTHRFVSEDDYEGNIAEPLSLHKYLYASGNPVLGVDPSGRFTEVELLKVSGIISLLITCVMKGVWDSVVSMQQAYNAPNWQDRYRYSMVASSDVLGVVTSLFGSGSINSGSSYALVGSGSAIKSVVVIPRAVAPGVYVADFVVYKGGVGPVNKGKAGVQKSIDDLQQRGGKVRGKEITMESPISGRRVRFDIVGEEADGMLVFIESKNGLTADLSANQDTGIHEFLQHGGIPRGDNADAARLPVGQRIPMKIRLDFH